MLEKQQGKRWSVYYGGVCEIRYHFVWGPKFNGLLQGICSKGAHDASWGTFLNQILPYKAWSAGKTVVKVNPNGTSQYCAMCGAHVPKSLSERQHRCPYCSFVTHRDINSAISILKLGLEQARRDAGFTPALCLQEAVG